MWGKYRSVLLVLILLAISMVALRGREIVSTGATNWWGLQVVRDCLSVEQGQNASLLPPAVAEGSTAVAWLTAQQAHCQQNDLEAALAWRQTLTLSPERLTLVRSAVPHDVVLAQYATELYAEEAKAFSWLGDAYRANGDDAQALQAYENGLEQQPEQDANAWVALGHLYEAEDEWQQAVYAYEQACHYIDQGKNGCPNAGRLYLAHEEYDLAAQRYRDSMRQLPGWAPAQLGLAQALIGLGETDEARTYLTPLANNGNTTAQSLLEQLPRN